MKLQRKKNKRLTIENMVTDPATVLRQFIYQTLDYKMKHEFSNIFTTLLDKVDSDDFHNS